MPRARQKFWINTIREDEAEGFLRSQYVSAKKRAGKVFNIIKCMSIKPQHIRDSMGLYQTVMFGPSGLTRTDREFVAVVVSQTNECFY